MVKPSTFFTFRHSLFLLLLLLGQSQLGFGQDGEGEGEGEGGEQPKDELTDRQTFTAVSSHFFRPGTDYKVFLTVNPHTTNKPLQLKCVLMANSSESTTIESDSISLRPGESGQITIPLPEEMPGNETVWRLFAWSFTDSDGYKLDAPHTLIVSRTLPNPDGLSPNKAELQAVFIQTDKPAYKPEDLVRIRVITMASDDRPHLTAGVNMTITDSQGNVMKKWEQPLELPPSASQPSNVSSNENVALFGEFQKKINGLSAYEFQLSGEPILGNWTIQVEAGNIKERMYFDVQRYILPKFQVKVKVPSVLYGTKDLTTSATIQVSYTYGKGLQGTGNVTVASSKDLRTAIHQIVVKDGEAIVPLTLRGSGNSSPVFTITANVTEKNTARWQTGKATVRVFPRESYSVQWINKPASYKPGLPITAQLKITSEDGFPVKDAPGNVLNITFPPSFNLPVKKSSIPPSGIVTLAFPTPLEPLHADSKLQVLYKKSTHNFTLPTRENGTSSGIFIEVVPPADSVHFSQGHSYNFTIRSNKPIQPELFHCLLWDDAAMEVHGAQNIINNRNASEFPFSLQLPKAAYTDLKIFVYFETLDGGSKQIISTSKSINTHNYLKIRVSRPIPKKAPTPTPAPEINGSNEIDEISSTVAPSPDAPLETTSAATTTTTEATTTTTSAPEETTTENSSTTARVVIDYEYDDGLEGDGFQGDGAAAAEEPEISDKLQVEPGDAVEIHFETYPDSTIAIRGIDQSLLLLTEHDNDLDREKVESKRASAESRQSQLDNIPTDNSSFLRTFHRLGISVLNSNNYQKFLNYVGVTVDAVAPEELEMAPSIRALSDDSRIPQVDSRLRTKFPETWLWDEIQSSNDSSTTVLSTALPDTLTSWIISGFSLNPKTGLGVASSATITGFMPFFVTLNLPYSVVKYESFELQAIVHNYLDRDVNVTVTLFNRHNNFTFEEKRQPGNKNRTVKLEVKKDHVAVASFVITPTAIGDIPIEVSAVTEDGTAGDSMLRHLKVKPDGIKHTRSHFHMFRKPSERDNNKSRVKRFEVEIPKKTVTGGSSVQLTVIGDQMGTVTSNLDHLLKLPGGCGEQNMAKFVPNILVLHYLSATHLDATNVTKKARRNLVTGYSHQLKFKQINGSFSIWSNSPGLTWLTSYVLKWFVVAQQYITIDPNVIRGAINFIKSKQQPDGSFVENGRFYHPEMQGRNGANRVALTAYITLALIKANETSLMGKWANDFNLTMAIEHGMSFISSQSVYQLDDSYITNLVAATLMAGNHPNKTRFFEKMESRANTTATKDKVKCWDMINQRERANGPLAIEMTSYALLAHLWKEGQKDSSVFSIYNWLLNQRNPEGGFKSTQDTVMGLTALTEYALKTKGNFMDEDELELKIRASPNSTRGKDTEFSVTVAKWNRMVLQEFSLPVSTKSVIIEGKGRGSALIQMTESWHLSTNKIKRRVQDSFNITALMRIPDEEEPSETELRVCVRSLNDDGARDSIASVQLPSGYNFYPEDYEENSQFVLDRPKNVERFELTEGNEKLEVYFTFIQEHLPTCIKFSAARVHKLAGTKDPPVVVYEYLNPENRAVISYQPAHQMNICQLCESTGGCKRENCTR